MATENNSTSKNKAKEGHAELDAKGKDKVVSDDSTSSKPSELVKEASYEAEVEDKVKPRNKKASEERAGNKHRE